MSIANPTLGAALELAQAGISVVPVMADGSKRPAGDWKQYQSERATANSIIGWFDRYTPESTPRYEAVGIITGEISGNLEMAEIEGRAADQVQGLQDLAYASGMADLWLLVCNGWLERSPSGGLHWFYRLTETPGRNTKLARRPATAEELVHNPQERHKVLTETRGEGGFVVVAPTGGTAHETGQPWVRIAGGPDTVPTLTPEQHQQFHAILASLNEEPPAPVQERRPAGPAASGIFGSVTPGDDYEAQTDWADILTPEGWRLAFTDGSGVRYWTRPGKRYGISATTGKDPERDRLYVFTSASDFEQDTPYTKFGAYAHLHHGGDHSAAASALRKSGMGKDPEISTGGTPSAATSPQPGASPFALPAAAQASGGSSAAAQPGTPTAAPEWWASNGAQPAAAPASSSQPSPASSSTSTFPSDTPTTSPTATPAAADPGRTVAHTDDGNAQLLIQQHGEHLRYSPDRGRWLHWTGNVWEWQPSTGGAARELAKATIRRIAPDGSDAARQWKKKSLSAAAISAMLVQAQTDPRITVNADQLDANGWELNTPDGIIDLRTATLLPPDPTSLHTKLTRCGPDFSSPSEVFDRFLATTLESDASMLGYIQRLAGYSAVGVVREHILPFGLGRGGNGKGVLFETLTSVLGDYATSAPPGFLMKTGFQTHPTDLARLHGARMVICSEVNPTDKFDEAKMKQLAGGDTITARFMRQDNFSFEPTHQLWLMGNHRPAVEAGGESFWRRLRLIPFTHQVTDEERIEGLQTILATEHGPKVLAWIARGAADYYRHGLQEPERVKVATREYAHDVDTVAKFLEDECIVDENPMPGYGHTVNANAFRNAYERYCIANGDAPLKGRNLLLALEEHGIKTGREVPKGAQGQRQFLGLQLSSTMFRPADDDPTAPSPFAQPRAF